MEIFQETLSMKQAIKVMLLEDHPSYRRVIERALVSCEAIELTSMFGAAEIALRHLKSLKPEETPDIILLDLNLPGISGLEAIELFLQTSPTIKIIVVTQSAAETDIESAISQGVHGYLLKSSTATEIIEGIQTVAEGGASIDGNVAAHVLKMAQDRSKPSKPSVILSAREKEILLLLSHGLVKKQIAEEIGLSYGTVATYTRRLYEKLDVQNGAAAVDMAYRLGILKQETN